MSGVQLRPHQEKAVEKLSNGKILWGGVGTGKSITALAYFWVKICGGVMGDWSSAQTPKDIYVITTAKKRDNLDWDEEAKAFGVSRHEEYSACGIKLTVDSWNNIDKYREVQDAFFIFDEQRLVGSGAWTKAFIKIAKHNEWILLSATPGDTWLDYIPVFIANGFYQNRTEFKRRHVVYNTFSKFPKVDRYLETGTLVRLRNELLVHMPYERHTVRHLKEVRVSYDEELFRKVVDKRWHVYENRPLRDVAELFSVMRKVVNSDPTRITAVSSLLEKHPKLIVFYNFDYELEILRTLGGAFVEVEETASGSTITTNPSEDSMPTERSTGLMVGGSFSIAEWNGHKHQPIPKTERWVYLVQYAAGAEGWNCIESDSVIFYSQTYSYKHFHQAHGRIDRLNTPFVDLYYYNLVSDSLIDKAIRKSLKDKKNFNESNLRL